MQKKILFTTFFVFIFFIAASFLLVFNKNNDIYAKGIPVLMYHNVVDSESIKHYSDKKYKKIFISTDKFKKQMQFLKDNNYKTLTLDELYGFVENGQKLPKNSVLITFDDGRKNVFINAYPILKENNFKAVEFIITSKIQEKTQKYDSLKWQYMSKEELKKANDVFEYASHTHNMHKRSKQTKKPYLLEQSAKKVKNDIETSLKYVDKRYFAYPYGVYNEDNISILKELGIKAAFTTQKGKVHPKDSLYKLKRYNVCEQTSSIQFKRILGHKIF